MFDKTKPIYSSVDLQHRLKNFFPASSNADLHPDLMLHVADQYPDALTNLSNFINGAVPRMHIDDFNKESKIADELFDLFAVYGTDKGEHKYHLIYGEIISQLGINRPLEIIEIGIGSQNTSVVSHMSTRYNPGAALRAFRDIAPYSRIYGADIDPQVLFNEDRIQTELVDQMNPNSFEEMTNKLPTDQFDLIIDDGLHAITPNLNTLLFGLQHIKEGGWIVIEDIWNGIVCWDTIYHLIPERLYDKYLIHFDINKRVFVIRKNPV